jgi:hypothetical protein
VSSRRCHIFHPACWLRLTLARFSYTGSPGPEQSNLVGHISLAIAPVFTVRLPHRCPAVLIILEQFKSPLADVLSCHRHPEKHSMLPPSTPSTPPTAGSTFVPDVEVELHHVWPFITGRAAASSPWLAVSCATPEPPPHMPQSSAERCRRHPNSPPHRCRATWVGFHHLGVSRRTHHPPPMLVTPLP